MTHKKETDKHNIVVENTPYSLFIYWLRYGVDNATYILSRNVGKKIIAKVAQNHSVFVFDDRKIENKLFKFLYVHLYQKARLYLFIRGKADKGNIFGSDHFIAFDIFRKYTYTLIEDGIGNYYDYKKGNIPKNSIKYFARRLKYGNFFGVSDNCKKIILTGLAKIPKNIQNKVEVVDLKQLWSKKTKDEQQKIISFFGLNDELLDILKTKDIVLLTQPISEDGLVTESEKIDIYRSIISKYDKDNLVVKTHPRETTDYKKYFPDTLVLDEPFPFEILNFLGIKFKKVATLMSTAGLNLCEDTEVEWYGTAIHPKLEEKIGDTIRHISPISKEKS